MGIETDQKTPSPSIYETVLSWVSRIADTPLSELSGECQLAHLRWDSFSFLEFWEIADNEYKVKLEPDDLLRCIAVNDLISLVENEVNCKQVQKT
jgi:acyl carrier protein